jgi:site-specific DNA-methyltransferase (adenine-specific)
LIEGFGIMGIFLDPVFTTDLGRLYQADAVRLLPFLEEDGELFDLIFVDPPFNLEKEYGKHVNDGLPQREYLTWMQLWLMQCSRLLAPGGSLMVYNLPKWNILAANFLMGQEKLTFVDWIAVKVTQGFPRAKGLYRAHYGIIHFTNGTSERLNKVRMPVEVCRHCGKDVKDYGGHRVKLHESGIGISDIWTDIPTVRHAKYKANGWSGPQLSTKLVRRCVLLTTKAGDLVLDPMAGSGTVPDVCEREGRRWVAIEKGETNIVKDRLSEHPVDHHESKDGVYS